MFTYCSDFIGYPESVRNTEFHGVTDSKVNFIKNAKTQGPNWEYLNLKFNYIRNSFGHRCVDFSELNQNNYILCGGCSLIEGIGIPVENRFSDIVSTALNCDMYNLGLGGTGNDAIFYNLVTWFTKIKNKPKLVIINWGPAHRMFTINDEKIIAYGISDNSIKDFILSGDAINYFQSKSDMLKELIRKIIDVPIIEIPWFDDDNSKYPINNILNLPQEIDFARNLMHPGIKTNKLYADLILDHIKKYYFSNT